MRKVQEGEKCVELVRALGLVGTTTAHGAKSPHKSDLSPLAGKAVHFVPDHDEEGEGYVETLVRLMAPLKPPPRVKIVRLPLTEKGDDLAEWLESLPAEETAEGKRARLAAMADGSPWVDLGAVREPAEAGQEDNRDSPRDLRVGESPDDPHRLARIFLGEHFARADGPALAYHRESFYRWDGKAYRSYKDIAPDLTANIKEVFDADHIEALICYKMKQSARQAGGADNGKSAEPPKLLKVTTSIVNNALQALRSETVLSWDASPPCWIDDREDDPSPLNILPARNGLVDLSTVQIRPHTPRFFSPLCLEYDFLPDAPQPERFKQFLAEELWPGDPASIRELQKWFGYLLTPDTRQQKILLLIGPPRSGKGTIARILERMIGRSNVVIPTLASFATNFGMWPLVDKTAALIKDARVTGSSSERAAVVERILNISGEDEITIDRKYLQPVTDKLMTRLVIISNEPPNFREASGALANRFAPLRLTNSFLGREDVNLTDTLVGELPGILRWFAVEGRKLLAEDGRFLVPDSASDLLDSLANLASPVRMFAEECCVFLEPDTRDSKALTTIRDFHHAFEEWCRETGHESGSENIFGRNLQAAYPKIGVDRPRPEPGSLPKPGEPARPRRYRGIELNAAGLRLRDRWVVRNAVRNGPQSEDDVWTMQCRRG